MKGATEYKPPSTDIEYLKSSYDVAGDWKCFSSKDVKISI